MGGVNLVCTGSETALHLRPKAALHQAPKARCTQRPKGALHSRPKAAAVLGAKELQIYVGADLQVGPSFVRHAVFAHLGHSRKDTSRGARRRVSPPVLGAKSIRHGRGACGAGGDAPPVATRSKKQPLPDPASFAVSSTTRRGRP